MIHNANKNNEPTIKTLKPYNFYFGITFTIQQSSLNVNDKSPHLGTNIRGKRPTIQSNRSYKLYDYI